MRLASFVFKCPTHGLNGTDIYWVFKNVVINHILRKLLFLYFNTIISNMKVLEWDTRVKIIQFSYNLNYVIISKHISSIVKFWYVYTVRVKL